ncbi:hypothetical protein IW262DRAFT_299835 [Armillaria fumosa]|nr:hypothetical protein IW262DRAFT_299835 [Armillaria fumosa]
MAQGPNSRPVIPAKKLIVLLICRRLNCQGCTSSIGWSSNEFTCTPRAQDEYKVEWDLSFRSPWAYDEVPLKDIRCQECEDAFPHDEYSDLDCPSPMQGPMPSSDQGPEVQDDQALIRDVQSQVVTDDKIESPGTSEHTPLRPLQEPEEPVLPDSDPDPLHLVDPRDFLLAHPEGLPHPNSEPPTDLRLGSFDFESESSLGLGPGVFIIMT